MNFDTLNDAVTLQGGVDTLLAGRFRIIRQLGQGGMGSVWLAEDTQLDDKRFAIKMLPSILVSNRKAYRQLKEEALVAMKLVHPNIVQIRAFEENNGNPFIVMDYIEGEPLDNCLEEWGTLTEDGTAKLLEPIASALDYAHSQGVVHRDIKPGNIMVRNDGVPFILDFGIAREMQETMTRVTGKLSSGTLLYMSPEQLRGHSPKPAQDIYSFAAMVYECIKGDPPFSRGQVEYQILNEKPEPLPVGLKRGVAIMRGLAKTPAERPQTCSAILKAAAPVVPQMSPNCEKKGAPAYKPSVSSERSIQVVPDDRGSKVFMALWLFAFLISLAGVGDALLVKYLDYREQQEQELRNQAAAAEQRAAAERAANEKRAEEERQKRAEEERQKRAEEERRRKEEEARRQAEEEHLARERRIAQQMAEEEARRREEERRHAEERETARVALENARKAAGERRKAAVNAYRNADGANARELAQTEFTNANVLWTRAKRTFESADTVAAFEDAGRLFEQTEKAYSESAATAKIESMMRELDEQNHEFNALLEPEAEENPVAEVAKEECSGASEQDESVIRPDFLHFCRYCGAALKGKKINKSCPSCGKNVFGK